MNYRQYFQTALLFFWSCSNVFAQDLTAYREASSKFASVVVQAEQSTGQDRLQTVSVDQLVRVLSDEKRFLKAEDYTAKELNSGLELCNMSNKAIKSLIMFSSKKNIDPKAEPQQVAAQLLALGQKNLKSFSRHLGLLQPFSVRCAAKMVPPMAEFTLSLPPEQLTDVRRAGLRQFKTGMAQIFVGAIRIISDPSVDEEYRLALLQSVTQSAPALISVWPVALRMQVRTFAETVGASVPSRFADYFLQIDAALNNKTCERLCRIE